MPRDKAHRLAASTSTTPSSGRSDLTIESKADDTYWWLVVSLVRHGESVGNASPEKKHDEDTTDPLTWKGKWQAKTLARKWKNTRIEAIRASPYSRAHDTALAIQKANKSKPKLELSEYLIERRTGFVAMELFEHGDFEAASLERNGLGKFPNLDRTHRPRGGGESWNDVEDRARKTFFSLLLEYAKVAADAPSDLDLPADSVSYPLDNIPEGIPHVVIVSHNLFLCEFYELLFNWDNASGKHITTRADYRNTEWSRHLLRWRKRDNDLAYWNLQPPPEL
ncbi:phosphoglycerate mutase-like protein [Dentipellis sp. KUC8613]|nr:phosphoglycerate mutase-like protein [Dentipellis sp. KUC8613]